jgi:hypothetical protein
MSRIGALGATVATQQPFLFHNKSTSLKDLGFKCCSDRNTHEVKGLGSIYISDLSKLNILNYANNVPANFTSNRAGYLTHIDGTPIILRRAEDSKKGDDYVNHIFNEAAAVANDENRNHLILRIGIPKTSARKGGTAAQSSMDEREVRLKIQPAAAESPPEEAFRGRAAAVSPSSLSSLSLSGVSLGQADRPAGAGAVAHVAESSVRMMPSKGLQQHLSRQPTRHRQIKILTGESTELTLNIDRQIDYVPQVADVVVVNDEITASSKLFPEITKINSANTSQIIAALYFATMEFSSSGFNDGNVHNVYYPQPETPLFTANYDAVNGNNAKIVEMIQHLTDFKVMGNIEVGDTRIYMSKNSFGRGDTSIYDAFKKEAGAAVSLLDILKVALNQLIDIRHILGPGGNIEHFYQNFSGGNGSIKNKQQKTRRLHRNGHYNSRKRYD